MQCVNSFLNGIHPVTSQSNFIQRRTVSGTITSAATSSSFALYYKNLNDHEEQNNGSSESLTSSTTPTQRLIQDIKDNSNGFDVLIEKELTTTYLKQQNLIHESRSKELTPLTYQNMLLSKVSMTSQSEFK